MHNDFAIGSRLFEVDGSSVESRRAFLQPTDVRLKAVGDYLVTMTGKEVMLECTDVGGAATAAKVALYFEFDPTVPRCELGRDVRNLERSWPVAVDR